MARAFLFTAALTLASLQVCVTKAQEKSAKPRVAQQPEDAVKYLRAFDAALDKKFGKGGRRAPITSQLSYFHGYKLEIRGKNQRSDNRYGLTIWKRFSQPGKPEYVQEETWLVVKEQGGWKVITPEKGVVEPKRRIDSGGKEIEVSVLRSHEKTPEEMALSQKRDGDSKKAIEEITQKVVAGMYGTRLHLQRIMSMAKKSGAKKELIIRFFYFSAPGFFAQGKAHALSRLRP